ncbi:hypothetical protein IMG5_057290 [Ichthyophthirius multifiliis]|uniref:AP-2 complex subunit alpha n=1 Tax=Ichthyophthirius multifiliis TaxID=5932 RepID=G0QND1_ICHMU|nr:hypothetical protein IMG5_057290 [Ichthyophthirius multifiliis]EGR33264.1 hypothetical protein IMG5_057290 [Ichthyophthirius multifiliis]|eukprot:XP_004037250.1 hypothetical protein IMG5_057290 [Ichthyophthirius multifiliis]
MSQETMNGLLQFIKDIRQCKNKEQEQSLVAKELAKIRNKFENKGISGYQRKKYVWKMLYMYILGYEIDFGHFQAANLINSSKFSEKYTGYIATGILVKDSVKDSQNGDSQIYKAISQAIKQDLQSTNEINQCLAISMIGALAPRELTEQLDSEIIRLALGERTCSVNARKKAILCLLRMYRKYNEKYDPTKWVPAIVKMFDGKISSQSFLNAASSLLLGVAQMTSASLFEEVVPRIVKLLGKLVINKECSEDYKYYGCPNPWLQVKLLKILSLFNIPNDESVKKIIMEVLKLLINVDITKSVNRNNVQHGILFEATSLIIQYGDNFPKKKMDDVIKKLGVFVSVREPNFKYLGLEVMCKVVHDNEELVEKHLSTILKSLKSNDISIKRRALDLLYLMCTQNTAKKIVEELLAYAEEKVDLLIREELVLKIAILAEKYADNLIWYIDCIIKLITSSGDYVTDDIWFRVIQMIVGFGKESNPELQKHAALRLFQSINIPHAHENLVRIGAFVISEYSNLLVDAGKDPQRIFDVLNRHYTLSSEKGRQMLLNAYAKLAARYPNLSGIIQSIFETASEHFDPDLQQRGVEYNALLQQSQQIQQLVYSKQPPYSVDIQGDNPLIKRIYKLKMGSKKEQQDPTVALENQRRAQEAVQFLTKGGGASTSMNQMTPQARLPLEKHIENLKNNVLYDMNPNSIVTQGVNLVAIPIALKTIANINNMNEIKNLLPTNMGIVYQSSELQVQYKSDYQQHMGKIAMQFESKIGKMENVTFSITNNESNGMEFNISPIKYDENPQIMMQAMSTEPRVFFPQAILQYSVGGQAKKVEFHLPIFTNKFIQRVEMPQEAFDKFWKNYSSDQAYKLDCFIPNPAPLNVPIHEVLKKAGGLLSNVVSLKVMGLPDMNRLSLINGVGQFVYKDVENNSVKNLPIMVQIEGNDAYKEHLRISLRGQGSAFPISNIYQIISNYMGMDN